MFKNYFKNRYLRYLNIKKTLREMDALNERLIRERRYVRNFLPMPVMS